MKFIKSSLISIFLIPIAGLLAAQEIKICTYNIRMNSPRDGEDVWPNRMDSVTQFIRQHDLVGLQEVTPQQFDDLRKSLTEFDSYGLGRDDGKARGEAAAVFYRKERLKSLQQRTLWLAVDPAAVGSKSWDAAITRTMTWIVFRDLESNAEFSLINTHFDHVGKQARLNSAKQIVRSTEQDRDKMPLIVMGDFNCTPDSAPYRVLADALRDARVHHDTRATNLNSTWNGFKAIQPGRVIDHIFVSDLVKVLRFAIENPKTPAGRFASDHMPVTATVAVTPAR